ncbi:MAG TPA: isocitrate/isopropylmalate family dehydrogenase, partial [Opitutales bacterium]|nr:isocitrate/isopropylmalate family dehydrogenase [Opitutales bacterium]
STNSMATIFAWTGALKKRGELDGLNDLVAFAEKVEQASVQTIQEGVITKDLSQLLTTPNRTVVNTEEFICAVRDRLAAKL